MKYISLAFVVGCLVATTSHAQTQRPIQYNRDVRPILSNHCFACHGFDDKARQANLRLDQRDRAIAKLESDKTAIVPGKPEQSELLKRIASHDPHEVMPPPSTNKKVSAAEQAILKRWIEQGAEYQQHWAFVAPTRPELPAVKNSQWVRNEIDRFVLARLEAEGLKPSPAADPATLLRRVSLDLTGLPPSIEDMQRFQQDIQKNSLDAAYEAAIDRLLDSDAYAERLTMMWLDLARYADTNGYNNDEDRTMWPWRDWVIDAFRQNMPFDRFITEQLAGDLLPNPTTEQLIATGFNRNHVITTEGGIIPEEYRVEYVADRVHTTASVFLGLSMQCARCHDHKYDPLSQRDYYRFFAFFNNVPDKTVGYNSGAPAEPFMKVLPKRFRDELANVKAEREQLAVRLMARLNAITVETIAAWERGLTTDDLAKLTNGVKLHVPFDAKDGNEVRYANRELTRPRTTNASVNSSADATATATPSNEPRLSGKLHGKANWLTTDLGPAFQFDGKTNIEVGAVAAFDRLTPFTIAAWINPTGHGAMCLYSKMDDAAAFRGYDCNIESGKLAVHLVNTWPNNAIKVQTKDAMKPNAWHHIAVSYDGSSKAAGLKLLVDGQAMAIDIMNDSLKDTLQTDKPFRIGQRLSSIPFQGQVADFRVYDFVLSPTDIAALRQGQVPASGLAAVLKLPVTERTAVQTEAVKRHYLEQVDDEYRRLKSDDDKLTASISSLEAKSVTTMIMQELPQPRDAFILRRGQYDAPTEKVSAGVPATLSALPDGAPANRLGLAQWLTDPNHPLTARVTVNRWWQMLFGQGLVETVEDFGSQGTWPTHPELLDWLALEFAAPQTNSPLAPLGGGAGGEGRLQSERPNSSPSSTSSDMNSENSRVWNIRATLKRIVLSATYRQSSRITPDMLERDPKNAMLARGPRVRLSAEAIRDQALFVSGLLSRKLGGPSVMPYQPDGLWQDVSVERRAVYKPSTGEDLYRRGMYTFWKRTCPPPTMISFDAPDRETCVMRRARTNTPLQALVLLNDPTYIEAARNLAARVLKSPAPTDEARLSLLIQSCTNRPATDADKTVLLPILTRSLSHFTTHPDAAQTLLTIGASPLPEAIPQPQFAAWANLANLVLNLDETITKE